MVEELFDLCHIYAVGRYYRRGKMKPIVAKNYQSASRKAKRERKEKKAQWKKSYEAEERKYIELLQREKRLDKTRTKIIDRQQNFKDLMGSGCDDHDSSGQTLYNVDDELLKTRRKCFASRQKLKELWLSKTGTCYTREAVMARRPQYTMTDRPYIWWQQREACSLGGGCCGRQCGCCEKPLRQVLAPSLFRPNKRTGVYGHCTAECGCCIKYREGEGVYVPDPLNTS
jgi:hypothetical protein